MRLPVDWDCLEIYPFVEKDHWKADHAAVWAENDIVAAAVANQFHEAQFQSLDPMASGRRQMAELLREYKAVLDSNPEREEVLQVFLKTHPVLLCPSKVNMWPKLPLGQHKTDFVFRQADGEYVLVELERSTHRLFIRDGNISSALNQAIGQVTAGVRSLEDNLVSVQRELGLVGIRSKPKCLGVIGRDSSLSLENRRTLVTQANQRPDLRVLTYDQVYANARAIIENLFGPIWEGLDGTLIYYPPVAQL